MLGDILGRSAGLTRLLFDTLARFLEDLPLGSDLFAVPKLEARGEASPEAEPDLRSVSDGVLIAPNFGVFLDGESISPSSPNSSGLSGAADSGRVSGGRGTWLVGSAVIERERVSRGELRAVIRISDDGVACGPGLFRFPGVWPPKAGDWVAEAGCIGGPMTSVESGDRNGLCSGSITSMRSLREMERAAFFLVR
jgi:hypothetical protein